MFWFQTSCSNVPDKTYLRERFVRTIQRRYCRDEPHFQTMTLTFHRTAHRLWETRTHNRSNYNRGKKWVTFSMTIYGVTFTVALWKTYRDRKQSTQISSHRHLKLVPQVEPSDLLRRKQGSNSFHRTLLDPLTFWCRWQQQWMAPTDHWMHRLGRVKCGRFGLSTMTSSSHEYDSITVSCSPERLSKMLPLRLYEYDSTFFFDRFSTTIKDIQK